ncbi:hypothetical protein QR680_003883 [Steinernema hermaphroditum]|uniref:Uncharacterized protein n=1 Tax=Steinernema hermaphroditum TaxID=289476 RepID=A0AA39HNB6_9BILA|nr:hypothetical protein QR680_003883 [Steinernema hermaphroditum]
MNPILKPTIHLIWVFAFFTLASFLTMHLFTVIECEKDPMAPWDHLVELMRNKATSMLVVLTVICCIPILSWLLIRNRKLDREEDKSSRKKFLVVSGIFVCVCIFQILVLGLLCYPLRTNLFWGYYYTKSFFCDVAKENVPKMLPGRYTDGLYNCHIPAHEFHNFVFLIVYWYLVASIFHQLFKMAVTLLAIFNVTINLSHRSVNFSFGNPSHAAESQLATINPNSDQRNSGDLLI